MTNVVPLISQAAADALEERGLELIPHQGQVLYTPPSTRQRREAYERVLRDGIWHQTKKGLTEEQRRYMQKLVRLQRKLRKARRRNVN